MATTQSLPATKWKGLALCICAILAPDSPVRGQCTAKTARIQMVKPGASDFFGHAVAVAGDVAVVGAPREANFSGRGSAHVYERHQGGTNAWGKVKKLVPNVYGVEMGNSVGVSGDTVVVGVPRTREVYVYERDLGGPGAWGERAMLLPSRGGPKDWYGASVAVAGDTILVGAPRDATIGPVAGAAYVYERDLGGPDAWGEAAVLNGWAGSPAARFGISVALSGDTAVIGAYLDDLYGLAFGAAYVFERDLGGAGAWGLKTTLGASPGWLYGAFGGTVSIDADTIVVGSPAENGGQGGVYWYERDLGGPGAWGEAKHRAGWAPGLSLGYAVSVSNDRCVVGASREEAYVYERDLGGPIAWSQAEVLTSQQASAKPGGFGASVAISGPTSIVGAPFEYSNGIFNSGAAYLFDEKPRAEAYCTAGSSSGGCRPYLIACGTPSASASSGFLVRAVDSAGASPGLFYFGSSGRQANAWGSSSSLQCVAPPLKRGRVLSPSGTAGACDGGFLQDLNAQWCSTCQKPNLNPGAGAVVQAQLWYQDPLSTSNRASALSDAVEFVVLP